MKNILPHIIVYPIFLFVISTNSPAQIKNYLIGSRDVIGLTIYAGGEKQIDIDLTVSATGMTNVPFIGEIKAKGLSTFQLEKMLTDSLDKVYFVNPLVNINIKAYHSLQYFISGAVNMPGLYEMTSETTLMELIAKAGGVLPNRSNIAYIIPGNAERKTDREHISSEKEPIKVDLQRLMEKGDISHNLTLQPGHLVYIPFVKEISLSESKVYVEGSVKNPGEYDYQPGLTALNACIRAGGFNDVAAPNRTRIIRMEKKKQVVIKINLKEVMKGRISDSYLKPGDLILVPEAWF
ncbi:MAG: polysaccharide export protein [Desulfobacteraceae bacterium]|nr:polysaccharide export protein [Desulfobacteraceae bacterium]